MGLEDSLSLVGQEIHECRVVRVVGEGGFAIVYEGAHKPTGARVAIKCLKRPAAFSSEQWAQLIEKFEDECRLLRQLGKLQPAIVRVLAAGKYARDGSKSPYMVMEWLEGIPLDAALKKRLADDKGPFPEHKALAIGEQLLQALATAHGGLTDEEGVTRIVAHRDIKPENLFYLDEDGGLSLKLIDFGIAKLRSDSPDRSEDQPGVVTMFQAFSPAYAAPEQFSRNYGDTGTWTDVYAVGLLLTELVTGRRALDGDDLGALFLSTVNPQRPTPRRRGAVVSDAIEELCQRALAVTPTGRYRDANEMLAALRRLRSVTRSTSRRGGPVSASPTPPDSSVTPSTTAPLSSSAPRSSSRRLSPPTPGVTPTTARPPWALPLGALFVVALASVLLVGLTHKPSRVAPATSSRPGPSTPVPSARSSPSAPPDGTGATSAEAPDPTAPASADAPTSATAPASAATLPSSWSKMTLIGGGTFTMGAADGEADEKPRKATVGAFLLDRREVTAEDYEACVNATACPKPRTYAQCTWGHPAKRSHPINCVTWAEAKSYCVWAKKRLPTEEEWEYAARGAEGRTYPWGEEPPHQKRPCWSSDLTCETGALPEDQTPEKIQDLAGNVAEWTGSPACQDGTPCTSERRTIRGGHFGEQQPRQLRGSRRSSEEQRYHAAALGFRCAADAPAAPPPEPR